MPKNTEAVTSEETATTPDLPPGHTGGSLSEEAAFASILEEEGVWTDPDGAEEEAPAPPPEEDEADEQEEPDEPEQDADEPEQDAVAEEAEPDDESDDSDDADEDSEAESDDADDDEPDEPDEPKKTRKKDSYKKGMNRRRDRQAVRLREEFEQQRERDRQERHELFTAQERNFEIRMSELAAQHRAELAELRASLVETRKEEPSGSTIKIDPSDPGGSFAAVAKAYGMSTEEYFKLAGERLGNEGQPTPREAMLAAQRAEKRAEEEVARMREEAKAEREEAARQAALAQEEHYTQKDIGEVHGLIEKAAADGQLWWREHANESHLQDRVNYWTRHVRANHEAITQSVRAQLARSPDPRLRVRAHEWVPTYGYIQHLVDKEFSDIHHKSHPDASPSNGSHRDKGSRDQSRKPAEKSPAVGQRPSNRAAAHSGRKRKLTDEEKDARFIADLEQVFAVDR